MKRLQFLAGLFGFGAAAQVVQVEGTEEKRIKWYENYGGSGRMIGYLDARKNAFLGKSKPVNGQCPVCGTMAPGYDNKHCAPGTTYVEVGGIVHGSPLLQCTPATIARCATCSNAFWQDGE